MKKIYLVDVSSMFFRAFYAIRPLTSPSGLPTNAIYGFVSMINKLIKEEKPEYLVFCYDRKEPSFRKEIDANYKAHRTEMPDDLAPQIPYIKKFADLMGIPSFEVPNYEADDVIGTLTKMGLKNQLEVMIVSGDKDFGQLIQPHVFLYDTMKDIRYDAAGVVEKWGVPPEQFIDYLALVGDTSDNIPGVTGIGPKGAQKLLADYKTLEGIYDNLDKISKSTAEKLTRDKDNAFLSRKLVTIVCDIPLGISLQDLRMKPVKTDELRALLHELNFKALEKTLLGGASTVVSLDTSAQERGSGAIALVPAENLEFKEETVEISAAANWIQEDKALWAINTERYLLLCQDKKIAILQGDPNELGPLLAKKNIKWSGFDLKGLWKSIRSENPEGEWDSMLAAYVLRASDTSDFEKILVTYTGETLPQLASPSQIMQAHMKLQTSLKAKLTETHTEKVLTTLDLPIAPILLSMEQKGIRIDTEKLAEQSCELAKDISRIEKEIHELAGEVFNIASPKQLGFVLFEKMKLPSGKKTKTGYSTDNEVLESLKKEHPIAHKIIDYRELTKLKSTYVDALPQMVDVQTGRVHTTFNQALTATGRLSSINPNLQNIPIRTERGARIRKSFIAERGCSLLSVDYSQIELRILAHIADDQALISAFTDDLDIHAATASEVFGVNLKDVTSEQRRAAKAVNFGIAYGQGAYGLAENLGISRGESSEIIKKYFARFSGVKNYMDSVIEKAKEQGYVETLFGRRRYLDELKSKNAAIRKFGERAAINAPIQGTAADLVKMAMIEVHKHVQLPLILQVHDELIFEAREHELQSHEAQVKKIMESVVKMKVPLKVNLHIGKNWDEAH